MTKNVNVELKFDVKAGKLRDLNNTLATTQVETQKISLGFTSVRDKVDGLAHSFQALSLGLNLLKGSYSLFSSPIKDSIHLNAVLEQQKLQLASLVNLNHQAFNAQGQLSSATTRWNLSMFY